MFIQIYNVSSFFMLKAIFLPLTAMEGRKEGRKAVEIEGLWTEAEPMDCNSP
jgi:hypothetical protein